MSHYDASFAYNPETCIVDNDLVKMRPPEHAVGWNAIDVGHLVKDHIRIQRWLIFENAKFCESFTGVFWIEDSRIAVKLKLLLSE